MRKVVDITLTENEKNLKFRIKQMSATQSESFTYRMLLLLAQNGGEVSGTDYQSVFKMLSNVDFAKVEVLLEDLLKCCSIVTDGIETQLNSSNVDGFIEERNTLIRLRIEAFKVNDFFQKSGLGGFGQSQSQPTIKRG